MRSSHVERIQAGLLAALSSVAVIIASEYYRDVDRLLAGAPEWWSAMPAISVLVLKPLYPLRLALSMLPLATYGLLFLGWLTPLRRRCRFSPAANVLSLSWLLIAALTIGALLNINRPFCAAPHSEALVIPTPSA
jgi:hypothetical protein